jgi:hypothetical protein
LHPGGQGVPFSLPLAAAADVEGDPGGGGLAVSGFGIFQGFRVDGGLTDGEQRVDGLPRPSPVQVRTGLGQRDDELAQDMSGAQSVACDVLKGVTRLSLRPAAATGNAWHLGHAPNYITTPPLPQTGMR